MKKFNASFISIASAIIFCTSFATAQTNPEQKHSFTSGSNRWSIDGSRSKLFETVKATFGNDMGFYMAVPPDVKGNTNLTVTQFGYVFQGRPEPEIVLADGRVLYVGSEPVSPSEKAFVITEADRQTIRAIAMLHQSCGGTAQVLDKETNRYSNCPEVPTLTFFVKQGETVDSGAKSDLVEWVKEFEKTVNESAKKQKLRTKYSFVRSFNTNTHVIKDL